MAARSSILLIAVLLTLVLAPLEPAGAQIDPETRDRVVPAAVQIAVVATFLEDGDPSAERIPVGSGTVVSPQGAILTNAHVADMAAHRAELARWEAEAAAQGATVQITLASDRFLILVPDGSGRPRAAYFATEVARDDRLDLAMLQVSEDLQLNPVAPESLDLAFVPVGDSDAVGLGDPLDVFGYPVAGGDALTYTAGVVSGFQFEPGSEQRAWITTDATLSGGSSGGTAVNRRGELVGVPTQGSALDCLSSESAPGSEDGGGPAGCVPVGGSIGQLRPINLALGLLSEVVVEAPDATQPPLSLEDYLLR